MAPRDPSWKNKDKIGNLMTRLRQAAEGKVTMTPQQIQAAKIFLSKTVPDLSRSEIVGDGGGPIETKDVTLTDKEILNRFLEQRTKK